MRGLFLVLIVGSWCLAGQISDSPATTRCHPPIPTTLRSGNLDTDTHREVVTATNVTCAHEYSFSIVDECVHQNQTHWLRGMGQIDSHQIVEANGRSDGRELFYVLRRDQGRAPDLGTAALVHLSRLHSLRCPKPRFLFLYQGEDPLIPPPRGLDLSAFEVSLVELTRRYRGREVRLVETFVRGQTERRRTTLLRYSAKADRYLIYSPKL